MINNKNLNQVFDVFLVKKIFSENYYQKYYIRKNFLDTANIFYNYKKNDNSGFSIYKNIFIYSHVYNNKFTFASFLNKRNFSSKYFLNNFYSTLINLKKIKKFFFLLKPIKGGFFIYVSGIIGFIPLNNILNCLNFFSKKIKTINFFTLLYTYIEANKSFKCFRFYVKILKFKVVLFGRKRLFSSLKKVKSRRFFFNSVFLLKKNRGFYRKNY